MGFKDGILKHYRILRKVKIGKYSGLRTGRSVLGVSQFSGNWVKRVEISPGIVETRGMEMVKADAL